jgi:thioester reductase-like protein
MCFEARRRGLPLSILRPGNMAPSSATGAWNAADFMYLVFRACLELQCAPDASARWQVTACMQPLRSICTFHMMFMVCMLRHCAFIKVRIVCIHRAPIKCLRTGGSDAAEHKQIHNADLLSELVLRVCQLKY